MQIFLGKTELCHDRESYVATLVELLVLKWNKLFVATCFLFVATKLIIKWTYKKKFVVTYFLYVTTKRNLGAHKSCREKIFICHGIIQLEHRQNYVMTFFAYSRQRIAVIQN